MAAAHRQERLEQLFSELAARFVNTEKIDPQLLVTVTRVSLSLSMRRATILVTVLPEDKENEVVEKLNKKRGAFGKFVAENSKVRYIPSVRFALDQGEKNRQRIEELLQ